MAEEQIETPTTDDQPSSTFNDDVIKFLTDIQGQLANMQQVIDKMAPIEEPQIEVETDPTDETPPEEGTPTEDEPPSEPSEDEINEIDKLLQED